MPSPAPNDLAMIEDFVNTFDLETGEEELASPEALTAWLSERGLAGEPLGHDDVASAVALREHLRALLLANNGGELDPSVPSALSAAADRAHLTVALDDHGRATVTPQAAQQGTEAISGGGFHHPAPPRARWARDGGNGCQGGS